MLALVEIGERRQQSRIAGRPLLEPRDRVAAPPGAGVRLDQHHRAVLPAGLLVHEIGQQRNRLVVRVAFHVQARERRAHVRIGFGGGAFERELEMMNRLLQVVVGLVRATCHPECFPTARRTPCRARGWPPGWTARSSRRRRRPPSPLAPCSASDTARRAAPEFRPQSDPVPSLACTRRSRRSRPRFPRSDGRAGTARMRRRFSRTPAAWESRAAGRVPRPAFRRARRPRRKSRPRTPQ